MMLVALTEYGINKMLLVRVHAPAPARGFFSAGVLCSSVSARDLVDSYMAPFQACVERGHVSSLMCSYNAINGVPACADSWLLDEVARGEWRFDGYITSDCDADRNVWNTHNTRSRRTILCSALCMAIGVVYVKYGRCLLRLVQF